MCGLKEINFDKYESKFNYHVVDKQKIRCYLPWWKAKIAQWFNIPVAPKYMYTIKGNHNLSTINLNTNVRIVVGSQFIHLRCVSMSDNNDTFQTLQPIDLEHIPSQNRVTIQVLGTNLPYE